MNFGDLFHRSQSELIDGFRSVPTADLKSWLPTLDALPGSEIIQGYVRVFVGMDVDVVQRGLVAAQLIREALDARQ